VAAYAPAGRWHLLANGRSVAQRPAYGWAASFSPAGGQATLQVEPGPLVPSGVTIEVLVWLAVAGTLVIRRRHGLAPAPGGGEARPAAAEPAPATEDLSETDQALGSTPARAEVGGPARGLSG
jgi:hypothetical protein